MKFMVFTVVISISMLVGCSHFKGGKVVAESKLTCTQRSPASADDSNCIEVEEDIYSKILHKVKEPCGLSGTIEERIKDCSYEKEGFALVARTEDGKEVHKEVSTGLLWSDRLPERMIYHNAKKACKADLKEVAGISDVTWRLPSIDEYEEAEKNGIRQVLPNMNYWFWSSTPHPGNHHRARLFIGTNGNLFDYFRNYHVSVRCVAKHMP
jgi:hypothetical protein